MNEPIGLTPADVWQLILVICGAIITVSGAISVIINLANRAKKPNKLQDQRISALEEKVNNITDRLEKGDRHFDSDQERMDALEQSMKETNQVIIESLQALTAHAIDGNNTQELKEAKKRLDDYLIKKV
jgi:ABC-type multidrug transport system fused ATPase/permease subunit